MTLLTIQAFAQQLQRCFQQNLPGLEAHLQLAPRHRIQDISNLQNRTQATLSSVLLLFFPKDDKIFLPFIRRPIYNGVHSGQIAFPGGRAEATDSTPMHTALRESAEEIGIKPNEVRVLGALTDLYIPPSNYLVSPFVGINIQTPRFHPDPMEVDQIIHVPFDFFLQDHILTEARIEISREQVFFAPAFRFEEHVIWGATAMILNEMITLWKTTVNT